MRTGVSLILVLLIASMSSPLTTHVSFSSDHTTQIFTLDVCSTAGNALMANGSMPAIHASYCTQCRAAFGGYYVVPDPMFMSYLIPFQQDRPPRA